MLNNTKCSKKECSKQEHPLYNNRSSWAKLLEQGGPAITLLLYYPVASTITMLPYYPLLLYPLLFCY